MNRNEKIKLLEAIEAGKLSVNVFKQNLKFTQIKDNTGLYECNGKHYTEKQMEVIAKDYSHVIGIVLCSKPADVGNPENKPVQILMINNV